MSITLIGKTVDAIMAALQASPAVCPVVDRVRMRPVQQGSRQAVAVRPVQAEPGGTLLPNGQPVQWLSTYAVECYASCGADTTPDVVADGLVHAVYARLAEDPTLSGAVVQLTPAGVSYDFDADGERACCVTLVFNARHPGGAQFV